MSKTHRKSEPIYMLTNSRTNQRWRFIFTHRPKSKGNKI